MCCLIDERAMLQLPREGWTFGHSRLELSLTVECWIPLGEVVLWHGLAADTSCGVFLLFILAYFSHAFFT